MQISPVIQKNIKFTRILCTFKSNSKEHTSKQAVSQAIYSDLLLAGCSGKSREEFLKQLRELGSKITVRASKGYLTFSILSLNENLDKTLELFRQILLNPNFEAKEIKRIALLLGNELKLLKENSRYQADRDFSALLFNKKDSRYLFDTNELISNISLFKKREFVSIHNNFLTSDWKVVISAQAKQVRTTKLFFDKINTKYPVIEKKLCIKEIIEPKATKIAFTNIPSKQNIEFCIGNSLPLRYTDPDYPAVVFGLSVLSLYGGFSGRLMSTVREKEGLTYNIYGYIEHITKLNTGVWLIRTFFSPKDSVNGVLSTLREIKKIAKNGITENELKRFKQILGTRRELLKDSVIKRSNIEHSLLLSGTTKMEYEAHQDRIQNMTRKEVNAALRKYLKHENLTISAAGPVKDVKKELQKIFS